MEKAGSNHEKLPDINSLKIAINQTMDEFCERYIKGYNRDRFDVLAFRYIGQGTLLTVFAVDKGTQERKKFDREKMSVKRFKINSIPASELLNYCASFNYTVFTGK